MHLLADRSEYIFEPNEDVESATPIELNALIPALSTCSDDLDFFSFTLEEAAMVTARTYITHEEKAPDAEWEYTSWGIHWLYNRDMTFSTLGAGAVTGGALLGRERGRVDARAEAIPRNVPAQSRLNPPASDVLAGFRDRSEVE